MQAWKTARLAGVVDVERVGVTLPEAKLDHPVAAPAPENGQFLSHARDWQSSFASDACHRSDTTHAVAARCRR